MFEPNSGEEYDDWEGIYHECPMPYFVYLCFVKCTGQTMNLTYTYLFCQDSFTFQNFIQCVNLLMFNVIFVGQSYRSSGISYCKL